MFLLDLQTLKSSRFWSNRVKPLVFLCLALEVAAGDAADGIHLLHEVDGEREEVVVLFFLGDDGGHEHSGVALRDEHGAGGLLSQFARFEAVRFAEKLEGLDDLFHVVFFLSLLP